MLTSVSCFPRSNIELVSVLFVVVVVVVELSISVCY